MSFFVRQIIFSVDFSSVKNSVHYIALCISIKYYLVIIADRGKSVLKVWLLLILNLDLVKLVKIVKSKQNLGSMSYNCDVVNCSSFSAKFTIFLYCFYFQNQWHLKHMFHKHLCLFLHKLSGVKMNAAKNSV